MFFARKKEIIPEIKTQISIRIKMFIEIFGRSSFIAAAAPVLVFENK